MVPKDKGWGMSNLGSWGKKTHVLPPCFVFPSSLINLFIVLGSSWGVMAAGGWGSYGLWEWGGKTVSPFPTCPLCPWLPSLFSPTFPIFTTMVGCSHAWSSIFTMMVCSFFLWMVGLFLGLVCWFACISEAVSPHAQAGIILQRETFCSLFMHKNPALISSRKERMQLPLSPRIFGCGSHSRSGPCMRLDVDFTHVLGCCYSSHDFWMWLWVRFLPQLGTVGVSPMFA